MSRTKKPGDGNRTGFGDGFVLTHGPSSGSVLLPPLKKGRDGTGETFIVIPEKKTEALGTTYQAFEAISRSVSLISRVIERYDSKSMKDVRSFYPKHLGLVNTLSEAVPHIEREFGARTRISVELDNEDGVDRFFVGIHVNMPVSEARARLKNFHTSWWNKVRKTTPENVYFDVEYT